MTTPSNSPYTPDLRGFIAFLEKEHPEQVVRISREVDPKFELSLVPATGNPGAPGMIQQVADFLLAQDIIKAKVDGQVAVDGSYVADYLKSKP